MALTSQTVRAAYAANGVTTTFAIPFTFVDVTDITEVVVYTRDESFDPAVEALKVNATHYSLTGNPYTSVEFNTAPASGLKVIVIRQLPITQTLDVASNSEVIAATSIESSLDRCVALVQQVDEALDRSVKLPITSSTTGLTLPEPLAGAYLKWNDEETGLENEPDALVTISSGSLGLPVSSTDNAIVRWDGAAANSVQSSGVTVSDAGVFSGAGYIDSSIAPSRVVVTDGSSRLAAATTTSATLDYLSPKLGLNPGIVNLGLTATVATSALTINIKQSDGSAPSTGTAQVIIPFRSATATAGTYSQVAVTSATSLVVSSGSTLGTVDGVAFWLYVYAINYVGTAELAISRSLFDDGSIVSTTAEGGAGGADRPDLMYSTTARSNVACRLIGRFASTQATAGTWATAIAEISLAPFQTVTTGKCFIKDVQTQNTAGDAINSGAWRTRTLNTITGDTFFASVAANAFTLQAGTYNLRAVVPGWTVGFNQARLQNTTDASTTIIGSSVDADNGNNGHSQSIIADRFTITAPKVFEIQHQVTTSIGAGAGGKPSNFTSEVYTIVEIEKILPMYGA